VGLRHDRGSRDLGGRLPRFARPRNSCEAGQCTAPPSGTTPPVYCQGDHLYGFQRLRIEEVEGAASARHRPLPGHGRIRPDRPDTDAHHTFRLGDWRNAFTVLADRRPQGPSRSRSTAARTPHFSYATLPRQNRDRDGRRLGIGRATPAALRRRCRSDHLPTSSEEARGQPVELIPHQTEATARAQVTDVAEPDAVERMVATPRARGIRWHSIWLQQNNAARRFNLKPTVSRCRHQCARALAHLDAGQPRTAVMLGCRFRHSSCWTAAAAGESSTPRPSSNLRCRSLAA